MSKLNIEAQVTGFMTVEKSNKLPLSVKTKVVQAPAGHVRKFQKLLVDPEKLPAELREQVLAVALENESGRVMLSGRAYVGGCDKSGKPVSDRKQSLTCRIAFKVNNLQSVLETAKATEEDNEDSLTNELISALQG